LFEFFHAVFTVYVNYHQVNVTLSSEILECFIYPIVSSQFS